MTTIYNIDSFTKGVNGFGLPFCDTIFTATLPAGTEETVNVPLGGGQGLPAATTNNKFIAVMQYGNNVSGDRVWVAKNATAAVPAGAAFAASTSEIEPPAKFVKSGDVLHFICESEADVSVAFYAVVD